MNKTEELNLVKAELKALRDKMSVNRGVVSEKKIATLKEQFPEDYARYQELKNRLKTPVITEEAPNIISDDLVIAKYQNTYAIIEKQINEAENKASNIYADLAGMAKKALLKAQANEQEAREAKKLANRYRTKLNKIVLSVKSEIGQD